MSSIVTRAGNNYLLDLLTNAAVAYPAYYVALIKSDPPTAQLAGYELDEPIASDYSRAVYANQPGAWDEREYSVSNALNCTFPVATTVWGQIKYWAVCTDATGGDVLWAGQFPTPITISASQRAVIQPGTFTLQPPGATAVLYRL